jgi:pentatricopeptide repeat protein
VKCGEAEKALELFQQMQRERVNPNPVTFVGVVNACASMLALDMGRHVHEQIIKCGHESNIFVANSLIDMYAKCGSIEDAEKVFNNMPTHDLVSWNAMIMGQGSCGHGLKALELFPQMQQEGMEPNPITFVGLLNACASVAALEKGRHIHEQIIQFGCEDDLFVANSLIDMYAKCGNIEDAQRVFNRMPMHNVVSWTVMLQGHAMHGHGKQALEHFEQVCQESVDIDHVTLVCLLSACSHAGLVDEGIHQFDSMGLVYSISASAEHYVCMVDLLGCAGHMQEAEDLIKTMPFEPHVAVWKALLGACRIHRNVLMGAQIAKQVLEVDPGNAAGYGLLSNINAAAGKWDLSANVQQQRKERGLRKQPGCSWIEVNNEVHTFVVDDGDHPQMTQIHAELKKLTSQRRMLGMCQIQRCRGRGKGVLFVSPQ